MEKGNKIGLADITCESMTVESYDFVNKTKAKTYRNYLIFIEKSENTECNLL